MAKQVWVVVRYGYHSNPNVADTVAIQCATTNETFAHVLSRDYAKDETTNNGGAYAESTEIPGEIIVTNRDGRLVATYLASPTTLRD